MFWKKSGAKSGENLNSTGASLKKKLQDKLVGSGASKSNFFTEFETKFAALKDGNVWAKNLRQIPFLDLGLKQAPSTIAYDSAQCQLAVGNSIGEVYIMGKPGMETVATLPSCYKDENKGIAMLEFQLGTPYLVIVTRSQVIYSLNLNSASLQPLTVTPADAPKTLEYELARNDRFMASKKRIVTLHSVPFQSYVLVGCGEGSLVRVNLSTSALEIQPITVRVEPPQLPPKTSVIDVAVCPANFKLAIVAYANLLVALIDLTPGNEATLCVLTADDALRPANLDPQAITRLTVAWNPAGTHAVLAYDHYLVFCSVQSASSIKYLFGQTFNLRPVLCRTLLSGVHTYQASAQSTGGALSIAAAGLAYFGLASKPSSAQNATESLQVSQSDAVQNAQGPSKVTAPESRPVPRLPPHYPVTALYWVRTRGKDETSLLVVGGRPLNELQGLTISDFSSDKFGTVEKTRMIATSDPVAISCYLGPISCRFPTRVNPSSDSCVMLATAASHHAKLSIYPTASNPTPLPLPASLQLYNNSTKLASHLLVPGWCYPNNTFSRAKGNSHAFAGGVTQSVTCGSEIWTGDCLLTLDGDGLLQIFTTSNGSLPNFFDSSTLSSATGCGWVCSGQLNILNFETLSDWHSHLKAAHLAFAQSFLKQYILVILPTRGIAIFTLPIKTDVEAINQKISNRCPYPAVAVNGETPTMDDVDELLDAIGTFSTGEKTGSECNSVSEGDSRGIFPDNEDLQNVWQEDVPNASPEPSGAKVENAVGSLDSSQRELHVDTAPLPVPQRTSSRMALNSSIQITDVAAATSRNSAANSRHRSSYYMSNTEITCANPYSLQWIVEPLNGADFRVLGKSVTVLSNGTRHSASILWLALPQGKVLVINLENGHTVFTTQILKETTKAANDVTAIASISDSLPPLESDWSMATPCPTAAPLVSTTYVAFACVDNTITVFEATLSSIGKIDVAPLCTFDASKKSVQGSAKKLPQQHHSLSFPTKLSLIAFDISGEDEGAWSSVSLCVGLFHKTSVCLYSVRFSGQPLESASQSSSKASVNSSDDRSNAKGNPGVAVTEGPSLTFSEGQLLDGRFVPVRDPETLKDSFVVGCLLTGPPKVIFLSFPSLCSLKEYSVNAVMEDSCQLTYDGRVFNVSKDYPILVSSLSPWLRQAPLVADYLHYEKTRQNCAQELLKVHAATEPAVDSHQAASSFAPRPVGSTSGGSSDGKSSGKREPEPVSEATKAYLEGLNQRANNDDRQERGQSSVVDAESRNLVHETKDKLEERGERLELLSDKFSDMEANSKTFLENAQKLSRKMESKKWWQI